MVPLIGGSASPARLLSFRGMGFLEELLRATLGDAQDKVMAGGTPANPAKLEEIQRPKVRRASLSRTSVGSSFE